MSNATSATPADILTRRRQLILDGDADGFADLFAPDAVIEVPFAGTPDAPMRLAGRETIRQFARRMMNDSPLRIEDFEMTALYQAQDPEVVIAEMRTKGTVVATGRPFSVTSAQIFRICDGLIELFRDFADPRILAEALS